MRRRILVADDSATIQKVIKIAFARFPLDIVEAASLLEALAAIGQGVPDALILDASLPGARGAQDFIKLRAEAGGAPVLVLIGTYEAVDEAALAQAGFNHVLKKPFESSDIIAEIEKILGTRLAGERPPPPIATTTATPPARPPTAPPQPATGAWGATAGHSSTVPGGGLPLVTPPLPGVHGNTDRSQHATVVHSGGFPGLMNRAEDEREAGDETPLGAGGASPYPPTTEQGLRGRRAFGGDAPSMPPVGAPGARPLPPAPGSATASGGASGAYGVPPPPLRLDLDDFTDDPPPVAPSAAEAGHWMHDSAPAGGVPRTAKGAPGGNVPPTPGTPAGGGFATSYGGGQGGSHGASPNPAQTSEGGVFDEVFAAGSLTGSGELPAWVRKAVEDYCERHFKSLAREVITLELRRLADEKARHLVDN